MPGHTGSVANLPTLNNQRLVPGIAIKDNLIYQVGKTGIVFSGAPTTDIAHAVPFGRIVNNTIAQSPFGIQVLNNAGPTILNNIISETTSAIFVDASSASRRSSAPASTRPIRATSRASARPTRSHWPRGLRCSSTRRRATST